MDQEDLLVLERDSEMRGLRRMTSEELANALD